MAILGGQTIARLLVGEPADVRQHLTDLFRQLRPGEILDDRQREPFEAGLLEDPAEGHAEAQRLSDPRDEPRGQQRVPAELEEVVLDADALDLQQVLPDLRQRRLRGVSAAGNPFPPDRLASGRGRARRSTLPLAVRGMSDSRTNAAGTM